MKLKCKAQAWRHQESHWNGGQVFWTWNLIVRDAVDVSIDGGKSYTSEAGALKAAHRFAEKYGIRIEE